LRRRSAQTKPGISAMNVRGRFGSRIKRATMPHRAAVTIPADRADGVHELGREVASDRVVRRIWHAMEKR
jgi:hypothetical protein